MEIDSDFLGLRGDAVSSQRRASYHDGADGGVDDDGADGGVDIVGGLDDNDGIDDDDDLTLTNECEDSSIEVDDAYLEGLNDADLTIESNCDERSSS